MFPDKGVFYGKMRNLNQYLPVKYPERFSVMEMSENVSRQRGILWEDTELK